MGPEDGISYYARNSDVAYNSVNQEYLVVWEGDHNDEYEIYGQRIDAEGNELGSDFRISWMGSEGDIKIGAENPQIVYNHINNQYLVVWGRHDWKVQPTLDTEIFGQIIEGSGNVGIPDNFQITCKAPEGGTSYKAENPLVAYNAISNEYLVTWAGYSNTAGSDDGFAQRLSGESVAEIGQYFTTKEISGPTGNQALGFNTIGNEYLFISREHNAYAYSGSIIDNEGVVGDDFQISGIGDNSVNTDSDVEVAFDYTNETYLVVYSRSTGAENEIYGTWLSVDGTVDGDDFRISNMGPEGDINYKAHAPDVAFNSTGEKFLVVWEGNDIGNDYHEAYGEFVSKSGDIGGDRTAQLGYMNQQEVPQTTFAGDDTNAGFVMGTNNQGDQAKSVSFMVPSSKQAAQQLTEVRIWFTYKRPGLTDQTYTLNVYEGDMENGPTGPAIFSQSYSLADIPADDNLYTIDPPKKHAIEPPVGVSGSFFVSIDFGAYAFDQAGNVSIGTTERLGERVEEVWQKGADGVWQSLSDAWYGGADGLHMWVEATLTTDTATSIEQEKEELPSRITLEQNYPNPFNPVTTIEYTLPEALPIRLTVYDVLGRRIAVLVDDIQQAGRHKVRFDARNLSSGLYFYRLEAGAVMESRKMILVK